MSDQSQIGPKCTGLHRDTRKNSPTFDQMVPCEKLLGLILTPPWVVDCPRCGTRNASAPREEVPA